MTNEEYMNYEGTDKDDEMVQLKHGDKVVATVRRGDLFRKVDRPEPLGKKMDMDLYK
ncbi:hypothetical protein [Bacillus phage CP-51]|uniref:Uncharacterized protein n=1 Tax=Bacillus phage CP-51 TaxID=1391188 RepID=A0A068EPE6_9CAUD|nr:hypothetical protein OZ73_gp154 [Bacillus phage CP-51]AID50589.1 hypothetical protein [Bacillus phage CP-51]